MRFNRFAALVALAFAFAPAARLEAQAAPAPRAHAGHHAQHAHGSGHAKHQGSHGATAMPCSHGEGHAATPAMLLMYRADLELTEEQVRRLQALARDDASGARAVLTAGQRAKLEGMHAAMMGTHAADAGNERCADCCEDAGCRADGECDAEKCREHCARMHDAPAGARAPAPRT